MVSKSRTRAPRKSPEERADEIRSAACQVARVDGLPGLTLRSVGARAGVAPALVAHYEPSMDELVASTFEAITSAEVDEIAGEDDRIGVDAGSLDARERALEVVGTGDDVPDA